MSIFYHLIPEFVIWRQLGPNHVCVILSSNYDTSCFFKTLQLHVYTFQSWFDIFFSIKYHHQGIFKKKKMKNLSLLVSILLIISTLLTPPETNTSETVLQWLVDLFPQWVIHCIYHCLSVKLKEIDSNFLLCYRWGVITSTRMGSG